MYDVIIIGAGPGGIFSAYELMKQDENLKIAVFDAGRSLEQRHCPIDGEKVKSCIGCKTCAIMNGFGGAGAFSDGKYNITNDFGGTLYEYIGRQKALELMKYVDTINMSHGGEGTKMYSTAGTDLKKVCLQNKLKLLDASVRHLGTDVNYVVLKNLYDEMKDHMDFFFDTPVEKIQVKEDGYLVSTKDAEYACKKCIVSVGRSGSKWMETVCEDLEIPTKSNRVDIGVRVELPAVIFSHLTDELYESKIVYRTEKFEDNVRTFCMNPYGSPRCRGGKWCTGTPPGRGWCSPALCASRRAPAALSSGFHPWARHHRGCRTSRAGRFRPLCPSPGRTGSGREQRQGRTGRFRFQKKPHQPGGAGLKKPLRRLRFL